MRIALAHPYRWAQVRRGGERLVADLEHVLTEAGHDVDVVTGSGRRLHRRLARRGLSEIDTFGVSAFAPLARRRPDVVHAFVPSAALAARAAGLPVVYTHLGLPRRQHFEERRAQRWLFGAAVHRSTVVAGLSRAAADAIRSLDVHGREVIELAPGVRLEQFPLAPSARVGPPKLLFASDASDPRKGLPGLLAALDVLLDSSPDARLQLAGPGDPLPALAAASARARAATDVLALTDVAARYRAATVTVLPSRYEAFGLVVVESLASGTPAVALAEGGPAEILDDPLVGRTAPTEDPAALASALRQAVELARDAATPERCARHARRYDWRRVAGPAHEQAYRDAISRRSTRRTG